jgi:predicted N-acyltransferase
MPGAMGTERYRVTCHASIQELPAAAWDALTGGNFYLSHRWLRVVEDDSQPPPAYLAAWSPDGLLAGGLPVYRLDQAPGNHLSDPASVVGDSPGAGSWYPALLGGARIGYASNILVDGGLPAVCQAAVCRDLLGALDGRAAEVGAASSSLLYLNQAGAAQVAGVPGWPLVFSSAEAALDVTWSSFEEYLAGMSRHRRANTRSDLRHFSQSRLELRVVPLGEVVQAAAPLAVNVQYKYGHQSSPVRQVRFFGDCAARLGDDALVFGCFDGGRLIGFGLTFQWRDTLYIRSAGFDYGALPRQGEHFMVMYYEPIRYAIEHDLAHVHFGTESFAAKVQRGCSLRPLWSAARTSEPFTAQDLRRMEQVSRARLHGWDEEFGATLGYLPSQAWSSGQAACGYGTDADRR